MKNMFALLSASGLILLSALSLAPVHVTAEEGFQPEPLAGLSNRERNLFDAGTENFQEVEDESTGLGPAFNGPGCASCHSLPGVGGHGNMTVLRAGHLQDGNFREIGGGSLIHLFSIPDFRCQPSIPAEANVRSRRLTTPLFGAGLVEAIADDAILALADPDDRNGDGIRGRAAMVTAPGERTARVGRFGWKAQHATLLAFAADAYRNEMGITNDLFPTEFAAGLTPEQLAACDTKPDPEDKRDPLNGNLRAIDLLAGFMKFLAPLEPAAATAESSRGERLFAETGCVGCHVTSFTTGRVGSAALDNKTVRLYSDLLLHDIGTGDGIAQGSATPNEFRTAPLWGVRFRRLLMHSGSAGNFQEAIGMHRGEANGVRARFEALTDAEKSALFAFLNTL